MSEVYTTGSWKPNPGQEEACSPEFSERMAQVQQHVEEFKPAELALVATAEGGAASKHAPDAVSLTRQLD